jgi:hypothetical protein
MAKFSLIAKPTFKAKVDIPVAGSESAEVEFTFKHRTKTDLKAWLAQERDDVTAILDLATGWDLVESFDQASVELLVQNHLSAPKAVFDKYMSELTANKGE